MSETANQSAPQIENPIKSVEKLTEKFKEFSAGGITVREFWEDEARGGLLNILIYFSANYKDAGMSQGEKDSIDTILSHVPPKLNSWKKADLSKDHTLRDQLDGEIREMYGDALDILRGCLEQHQISGILTVERTEPYQAGSREFKEVIKVLLELLDIMDKVSLIDATATRCVMESNIPNNMLSIVNTATHGASQCQHLCTDYEKLSGHVDTLLPAGRGDRRRREEVQGASKEINVQIGKIAGCFSEIATKKGEIVREVGSLRSSYRTYCEITISEILTAKGLS